MTANGMSSALWKYVALVIASSLTVGAMVGCVCAFSVKQVAIFAKPHLSDSQLHSIFLVAFTPFFLMGLHMGFVEIVRVVRAARRDEASNDGE